MNQQHLSNATSPARVAGGDAEALRRRAGWIAFWVVAALLFVVALLLRLERIGEADLWLDEAFTWERATQMQSAWETVTCATTHPPLTRLGVRFTSQLFGDAPAALRILPLLASLACLPLLGLVLWRVGLGRLTILVALALLALNPAAVDLANWVRHYSPAMALGLWLTLVYLSLMRKPSTKHALHYGVVLALGMYTYYLFFLIPLAHALCLLTSRQPPEPENTGSEAQNAGRSSAAVGILRLASKALDGASRAVLSVPWFVDMLTRTDAVEAASAKSRWFAPGMRARVGALVLGGGLAFVLFLPWMLYLFARWPHLETAHYAGHASTFEQMTHWMLTSFLGVRYREQGMMDWQRMLPAAYAGYYVAVIAVPLLLGALCLWRQRHGAAVLAWLGFVLPWLFLFTLGIWINMFGTYWHFSFILPFVLAVVAVGFAQPLRWGRAAVVVADAPPRARFGGALAGTAAAAAFVALLGSAVYGLSAQHGWGLMPERDPNLPLIGYDDEPMQRGPWRAVAAEIRRVQQHERDANVAVIAFPHYLKAALRYEIRDLPVLPYAHGEDAAQRLFEERPPVVNERGAYWPSLTERAPDTLWIVAPTWKRDARELAELMTHLHGKGYRVTLHTEVVALYREVYLWRATPR